MKYYSEILKKNFDTVEELEQAEATLKAQFEKKVEAKKDVAENTARKEAAKKVEEAFEKASKIRKDNSVALEKIEDEENEIGRKYDAKRKELEHKYQAEVEKIDEEADAEFNAIDKRRKELEKAERQASEDAYAALKAFCKEYGAFHYSVDTKDPQIFPMLMGFDRIGKANDAIGSLFSDFLKWF